MLQKNHSATAAADCNAVDWLLSHYIVPHEKSALPVMWLFLSNLFDNLLTFSMVKDKNCVCNMHRVYLNCIIFLCIKLCN